MKRLFKFMFVLAATVAAPALCEAQINYSDNSIWINGAQRHLKYEGIFVKDWTGVYWTCNNDNFLQIDVSPANPRIAGTGNKIVFFNTATGTYNSLQVANVYNYSDERAKENIHTLTTGLDKILNLRPVSYNWRQNIAETMSLAPGDTMIAKGPADDGALQYGFLAQEVESVVPEAVKTNDDGSKLINYTALIPLLVQAVQDLQATVEAQAAKIEQLTNATSSANSKALSSRIVSCTPNPTAGNMTITTKIDGSVRNAVVAVTNLAGNREKTINVSSDMPTISEDISSLDAGIHVVSLYADDVLCNSLRIVKE